jgi:glycine/D-amino acid oxidase-like deaminating enzyme
MVAGGLFNPVTGKKLQKTWLADQLFPYLHDFYPQLEKIVNANFFFPKVLYRPFAEIAEANTLLAKTADPDLADWLHETADQDLYKNLINNDLGGLDTLRGGRVDVPVLLEALDVFFREKGITHTHWFDPSRLSWQEEYPIYEKIKYEKVIFCEGVVASHNPWWDWVPFNPVKGEILEIGMPEVHLENIVNHGVFLYQHAPGRFTAGSTYSWKPLDWENSEAGRNELQEKLNKLLRQNYVVLGQRAGIRPAMQGRRPVLGAHPEQKNLLIFNGLGSKGVSLAPFFSNHLAEFCVTGKEIMPEVNIARFYSFYDQKKKSPDRP